MVKPLPCLGSYGKIVHMKKFVSKTDVVIIALCLISALSIFFYAKSLMPKASEMGNAHLSDSPILKASETGYVRIQVDNRFYRMLPLSGEGAFPIAQGKGKINVVEIKDGAVRMLSSTCKNQNCVHQGKVTLENRDTRPLFNAIVCLPNQVLVELLAPDEVRAGEMP